MCRAQGFDSGCVRKDDGTAAAGSPLQRTDWVRLRFPALHPFISSALPQTAAGESGHAAASACAGGQLQPPQRCAALGSIFLTHVESRPTVHLAVCAGPLPDWLGLPTSPLEIAYFAENRFVGTLPASLGKVPNTKLLQFDVEDNLLSGECSVSARWPRRRLFLLVGLILPRSLSCSCGAMCRPHPALAWQPDQPRAARPVRERLLGAGAARAGPPVEAAGAGAQAEPAVGGHPLVRVCCAPPVLPLSCWMTVVVVHAQAVAAVADSRHSGPGLQRQFETAVPGHQRWLPNRDPRHA